jgi:hypothetical protein
MVVRLLARELEALREAFRGARRRLRRAWANRPSARRAAAIAFVAAALASGALALAAQLSLPGRLPTHRDWAAVVALVERDARPGDALVLSPPWAERARERLPASIPVLAHARYDAEDLVGVRRVWVLSLDRAPGFSWQPELDVVQRGSRTQAPERVGAFEVTRYDLASPTLPLAFLPDRLQRAEVFRGGVPCPPDDRGAFRCGGARVEREVREIAGAPRPCLVVGLEAGAPVSIVFPGVRVGRVLHGHVGALGPAVPVRISVVVNGDEAGAAEVTAAGFAEFRVDTTRLAGEARHLTLVLTTPGAGDASVSELCLDAMTLP